MTRLLTTLLLLSAAALALAQGVTVRGTVTDALTGRRLNDVRLRILADDGFVLSNSQRTGRNGTFTLELPTDGVYSVDLLRSGYLPGRADLVIARGKTQVDVAMAMERLPGYEFEFAARELNAKYVSGNRALLDTVDQVRVEIYDLTAGESLQDSVLAGPRA